MNEIEAIQIKLSEHKQNFESFKISIKLPKIFLSAIETITLITDISKDELFNTFIVNQLEFLSFPQEYLIRFILKNSNLIEQLRIGLNQYYGEEQYKPKQKKQKNTEIRYDYEIVEFLVSLPKKIIDFINILCEISNLQKEVFLSDLIIYRFEDMYSDKEVFINYIDVKSSFFEDLREGINYYYEKKVVQKENNI